MKLFDFQFYSLFPQINENHFPLILKNIKPPGLSLFAFLIFYLLTPNSNMETILLNVVKKYCFHKHLLLLQDYLNVELNMQIDSCLQFQSTQCNSWHYSQDIFSDTHLNTFLFSMYTQKLRFNNLQNCIASNTHHPVSICFAASSTT